jgi:sulfur-carrier protein
MRITVKYFAGIREAAGCAQHELEMPGHAATIEDLRLKLSADSPALAQALADHRQIRFAIDFCLQPRSARLHDGCEVAFFPPVTGG